MYNVFKLDGSVAKSIELPSIFSMQVNLPVIRRAVVAEMSARLQPQGHYILAGMQTTAAYYGAMSSYRTGRHMGIAIRPREKLGGGTQGKVKRIPSAVKGKRAHPHMIEKRLAEQINKKEYQKAIASAIAATRREAVGSGRSFPLILSDDVEKIAKTKELMAVLKKLGMQGYIDASRNPSIRKGLRRSSRVRIYKKSLLFIFSKGAPAIKAARNIPGADACDIYSLTANMLAGGGNPGRITVWSESAINGVEGAIKNYNVKR
ncbi:MAG: 50S ribosomal protein L4 [Candidatus Marsarchaeota archaeon]|jgi:large subunit ribosomal protein L4e|nr:50S ribosomal protein L4 [Candidatus Marsarchaeota archaeon]MCL5418740.1 50S ribosomal protein L4 [Candidatus Marsarchaeota archaeon]